MKFKVKKEPVKIVLTLLCVFFLVAGIVLLLQAWEQRHYYLSSSEPENSNPGELYYNGEWYKKKKSVETILLIGVDKYSDPDAVESYINTQQSDFLIAVVADHAADTYCAIPINRDTMAEITTLGLDGKKTGTIVAQLALAHTYGTGGKDSAENTAEAVSKYLYSNKIDHYIAVTMDAVSIINDAVGGVTVTVLDDINQDLVKGETVTLMGQDALAYVRARGGLEDSTNVHRMERQQQYLEGLKKAFEKLAQNNSSAFSEVLLSASEYMTSDCTVNELSRIYNLTKDYEFKGFVEIPGESKTGEEFMEFYTDEDKLREIVVGLYYTKVSE